MRPDSMTTSRLNIVSGSPRTVAVLGQGSIGRRHARLLLEAGCDVVVYDPLAPPGGVTGVRRANSAIEALDNADAAVVASPSSEHLAQATLALEHGCHVLVEKPLAVAPAGTQALVERAAAAGLVLAVGFNLRFHPGPSQLRAAVASGAIGRPLRGELTFGSWLPGWRPGTDYRTSYSAKRELGGGVLLDAIHELDYAAWILGDVIEASAWLAHVSELELDVEDTALLTLRHAAGALTAITLDYLDRAYRRGCRIVGSEGSVDWRWGSERITLFGGNGDAREQTVPSSVEGSYRAQIAAFMAAVEDGAIEDGAALCDGAAGAHAVAIADAARRSDADGGRRVIVAGPSAAQ